MLITFSIDLHFWKSSDVLKHLVFTDQESRICSFQYKTQGDRYQQFLVYSITKPITSTSKLLQVHYFPPLTNQLIDHSRQLFFFCLAKGAMPPCIHPNVSVKLEQIWACSVMNFTVKDKFEINLSPWTSSLCRTLIISTISSATPRGRFFFLLFLSPSSPVCFYPCKMLVALLKYCSALSALFFLPSVPLSLFFLPSLSFSPLDGWSPPPPPF